jgi:hypothetical protein
MPIKVQCRCGRVMLVKDEMAGKTGRCPACQQPVKIPFSDEEIPAELVEDEEEVPRRRSQAIRSRRDEDDFDEDDRRPRRKRAGSRRDEDYDDYDDYDDRRRRKARRDRKEPVSGVTITLLSIGIGVLLFAGLSALPRVYTYTSSISSKDKAITDMLSKGFTQVKLDWPGFISNWRGITILILSIILGALAVATLVVLLVAGRRVGDIFLIATTAASAAWGVLLVLWFLGYVFKGFAMSESRSLGDIRVSVTILPGWGLFFGLVFAAASVGVFAPLIFKRSALWGLVGMGVGFVGGLLLLLIDARPWESPFKELEKAQKQYIKDFNDAVRNGKKPPEPPKLEKPWFFPQSGQFGSLPDNRFDALARAGTRTFAVGFS